MIIGPNLVATLGSLNASTIIPVEDAEFFIFQTSGTWAGTITPQISLDGSNWDTFAVKPASGTTETTNVATVTSNACFFHETMGAAYVRLIMTAYTSGSCIITTAKSRSAK